MAKTAQTTLPGRSRQTLYLELSGVVLFVLSAFLLLAFTSFAEVGSGVAGGKTANLCGAAGYAVARTSLHWFGYGAYVGLFILFTWALALIGHRQLSLGPFRLVWFGSFLFCTSALFSHFGSEGAMRLPDAGGLVGFQVATFVENNLSLGPWGSKLVLLMLVLVTFQLATDFLLYTALLGLKEFIEERRETAARVVRGAGPLFSTLIGSKRPQEALAVATAAPASRRSPRSRRTSPPEPVIAEPDFGVTDEEVEGFGEEVEDAAPARRSRKEKHEVDLDDEALDVEVDEEVDLGLDAGFDDEAEQPDDPDEQDEDEEYDQEVEGEEEDPGEEPVMLDEDPESEVDPILEEADLAVAGKPRSQATIHFDPPKEGAQQPAGFDHESITYAPPPTRLEYVFPSIELLERPTPVPGEEFQKMIEHNIEVLESSLASYKVEAEVEEIQKGPVITMFELNVAPGTRVDKIRSLEDDLAIRVKAPSVRIVAPIPGKSTIGIEVPNKIRETVRLRELVTSPDYQSSNYAVPVFIGKDAAGRALIEDLAKMPHVLVAGATGAGKSVCLNTIIMSILYTRTPDQVKMILIDPKMVELSSFESIPHLMCPVIRDMSRAAQILEWAVTKMDERYNMLAEVGARNIFAYNKISEEDKRDKLNIDLEDETFESRMPFIIIVVDELADLMMVSAKEVENYITRLAQKSRAVGIHIVLATQRPSTNVITGLIKANMPTRISFQVASKIDSRVVLDQNGAEKLLGFGDMLYMPPRSSMLVRSQGTFVTDDEIRDVVNAVKTEQPAYARELVQKNTRSEVDPREVDSLYDEATRFICETKRGSASLLQRKFAIGYTRASRLIDLMAEDGILGEFRNAQAREVLVTLEEYEARQQVD